LTIERAIHFYVQAHRHAGRSAKTLEWHQTALRQLQHYLLAEGHLLDVRQITETDLAGWVAELSQTPTRTGKQRSASTIETYARSARAFCVWLVQRGDLARSPMSEEVFPHTGVPLPRLIQPDAFEQFLHASFPSDVLEAKATRLVARDRALLWVLFDTGISVCEVCALRVGDLDQTAGTLRVWGKGGKERWMVLGPRCLDALRALPDQPHVPQGRDMAEKSAGNEPLFGSERGGPLTKNSLALLFRRLRERSGSSEMPIGPQILRHSFALRYLQAGGDPRGLQELLGYTGMALVRQYLHWHDQLVHDRMENKAKRT
jgi:site-specific recombinase XerD